MPPACGRCLKIRSTRVGWSVADVAVYFTCPSVSVPLMAILADAPEPGIAPLALDEQFLDRMG